MNIHFIYGNHDHHIERNSQFEIPTNEEKEDIFHYKLELENHDYPNPRLVNTQDFFSETTYYKKHVIHNQLIIMSHYAMRVWDKSNKGAWMLYGHSHGTLDINNDDVAVKKYHRYRTMDVGIDTHPEFRPYHFDEIKSIMSSRKAFLDVDHHSPETN